MASRLYDMATTFATDHRGLFVTVFVLPISLLFDMVYALRAWLVFKFYSAPLLHKKRVSDIQAQIVAWKNSGSKSRLCTSRGGWQSISPSMRTYKKNLSTIDINLFDILELNKAEGWVHVEPMVSMGQLSHYLVPHGLTIPVLPEMDDLTVGGLLMGVGIETSSHIFGLFNDCVLEAEVVLANGEVNICSATENSDMFDALPWSYGTLGFLASVKIRVIRSKPFVRIEYIPCTTQKDAVETFTKESCAEKPADFVEALMYSYDKMVVMPARFVEASEVPAGAVNRIGLWYKPWFFRHVESFFAKGRSVEYLPLRDYYHRHTKSIFWELEQIIPWGNHPLFRLLLGWAVPPKVSFLKLTQTESIRKLYESQHVIQDMLVPMTKLKEGLDCFDKNYEIYPLWVCPHRLYTTKTKDHEHRSFLKEPLKVNKDGYEMYVDIGAYGIPRAVLDKQPFDIVAVSRRVEAWVESVRGFQMLYATSYQTLDEFRTMFNHKHYDAMKKLYDPGEAFPQVFEKVCQAALKSKPTKKDD